MRHKAGNGEEVRSHDIGNTRNGKEQAEYAVYQEGMAEPAADVAAPFQRGCYEDGQGQPAGHDIRRQFRIRNTVEEINQASPQGQEAQGLLFLR